MSKLRKLKHFWIMLFATLSTIFMIHFVSVPYVFAAIFGAFTGFGVLSVVNYSQHGSFEE